MNRSNVGNVITNGMQILSVGTTNAKRLVLGRADMTLNAEPSAKDVSATNLNNAKANYYNSKANEKTDLNNAKTEYYKSRANANNELAETRRLRNQKTKIKSGNISVDELMQDNSEQVPNIRKKIINDMAYMENKKFYKELNSMPNDYVINLKTIRGEENADN